MRTNPLVNGIEAWIYTPLGGNSFPTYGDGTSHWIALSEADNNGFGYWVSAGWEHIPRLNSVPSQYVEACSHYDYNQNKCTGTYYKWEWQNHKQDSSLQPWGTLYEYWVNSRVLPDGSTGWCGYSGPQGGTVYERYCQPLYTSGSKTAQVRSESHDDANEIFTSFTNIKYKDPIDNSWHPITQRPNIEDFIHWPYQYTYTCNFCSILTWTGLRSTIFLPTLYK